MESSAVEIRLQDFHRSFVEKVRVVIPRIAGKDLDIVRAGGFFQPEGTLDGASLHTADFLRVKADEIGDVRRIHNQTVVGDDGDAPFRSLRQRIFQQIAVNRAHDDRERVLLDGGAELLGLLFRCLREAKIGKEAVLFQRFLQGDTVPMPTVRRIGE